MLYRIKDLIVFLYFVNGTVEAVSEVYLVFNGTVEAVSEVYLVFKIESAYQVKFLCSRPESVISIMLPLCI